MCSSGRRTHEGWHLRLGLRVGRVVFSVNFTRRSSAPQFTHWTFPDIQDPACSEPSKYSIHCLAENNSISKRDVPYDVLMGQMLCVPTTKKLSVNSTRKRWKKFTLVAWHTRYSLKTLRNLWNSSLCFPTRQGRCASFVVFLHNSWTHSKKIPCYVIVFLKLFLIYFYFSLFPSFLTQESDSSLCS